MIYMIAIEHELKYLAANDLFHPGFAVKINTNMLSFASHLSI